MERTLEASDLGTWVWGSGFRDLGLGFRIQGVGLRVKFRA